MYVQLWRRLDILVLLLIFLNFGFLARARVSSFPLIKRLYGLKFQPDDVHIQQAVVCIFNTLKESAAKSQDMEGFRFVITGGVAVNHWFPEKMRPIRVIISPTPQK